MMQILTNEDVLILGLKKLIADNKTKDDYGLSTRIPGEMKIYIKKREFGVEIFWENPNYNEFETDSLKMHYLRIHEDLLK